MSYSPLSASTEDDSKHAFLPGQDYPRRTKRLSRRNHVLVVLTSLLSAGLITLFYRGGYMQGRYVQTVLDYGLPFNYTGPHRGPAMNQTLGFQKIFALNLPNRVDKRDELSLIAYASDLKIDFIDGVRKQDYENTSIAGMTGTLSPGVVGCYRSHVNVMRKIVDEGIETALIFEDDIDWDVDIKSTMQRLQDPLAALIGSMKKDGRPRGPTPAHPWGDNDWDLLYLGACMEGAWEGEFEHKPLRLVGDRMVDYSAPPYLVYQDDTAPDTTLITDNPRKLMQDYKLQVPGPDDDVSLRRRVLQRSRTPICTPSYAVTRRGAARLLYLLTRQDIQPVDWLMSWAAEDGSVESYSVFPPIIDQWRVEGSQNSDINRRASTLDKRGRPDRGHSWNIRNSVHKNLEKTILPPRPA